MENKRQILHMCDFCSKEIESCQADFVRAKDMPESLGASDEGNSVIACDQYESPVELLKKRFHDYS